MVETRRATDKYSGGLVQNKIQDNKPFSMEKTIERFERSSVANKITAGFRSLMSMAGYDDTDEKMVDDENNTPSVFAYSLFYVYYDQYTYITGVLA